MFAINHAASALLFKRHLPETNIIWLLLSVQVVELLWVGLVLLGIEHVTTEPVVEYVGHIHLSYMPFSHSLLSSMVLACLVGTGFYIWKQSARTGVLMGMALLSHVLLDALTHTADLPLLPGSAIYLGIGLYDHLPILAFVVEVGFGLLCWWYYRGNKPLFWIILLGNLANLTFFVSTLPGPEKWLPAHPSWLVYSVLFQILLTLSLVGYFSGIKNRATA